MAEEKSVVQSGDKPQIKDAAPPQQPAAVAAPADEKVGAYTVLTATREGQHFDDPDPGNPEAAELYVYPHPNSRPTDDQQTLLEDVGHVLTVVQRLYLDDPLRRDATRFRRYYVRIFRLAQVGLEGGDPVPKTALSELKTLKDSLIEDEGFGVKTRNISKLGETALMLSLPLAIAYFVLLVAGKGDIDKMLTTLRIDRTVLANFLILWIGCFTGVCLSYGIRTTTLTLTDLISPSPDRLPPSTRLLFIGTLTMLFGLLFTSGIVELKLGSYSTAQIATDPTIAFIVGTFFGLRLR